MPDPLSFATYQLRASLRRALEQRTPFPGRDHAEALLQALDAGVAESGIGLVQDPQDAGSSSAVASKPAESAVPAGGSASGKGRPLVSRRRKGPTASPVAEAPVAPVQVAQASASSVTSASVAPQTQPAVPASAEPARPAPAVPLSAAVRAKAMKMVDEIQYATEAGSDTSALEADLLLLADEGAEWLERIGEARRRGEQARCERERLDKLLQGGPCSAAMKAYWRDLPSRAGWFKRKASRQIAWKLGKELQTLYRKEGLESAERLMSQARFIYGEAVKDVSIPAEWRQPRPAPVPPDVVRHTVHSLPSLRPSQEWDVYIDENGMRFSAEEKGTEGRVVAVCLRQGAKLPNLGHFHSTEAGDAAVVGHFNELLQSDCGILGFTRTALGTKSREGWLQSIRELVKWVWRLVPLQKNGVAVGLRFHVEQRHTYKAELETELSEKMLVAELARENPQRVQQVRILSFSFENKDAPMLAWADIVAHLWGKTGFKPFRASGLEGTSLVDCSPSVLNACEAVFTGGGPDGEGWLQLMQEEPVEGSLPQQALALLQSRCKAQPERWERYAKAMQDYLAGKQYALNVLERMSGWLRPMDSPSLAANFFWHSAELARLNHMGDVGSPAMLATVAELERLAPEMGKLDPVARLHVALRMAVADSNAFNFAGAEARLAPWNPLAGGRLTGSSLWDGKILSSLGQYRAFQNDPLGGARLFEQALDTFGTLQGADAAEAARQMSQTGTYLAVALMDSPGIGAQVVRWSVEKALGTSIAEAAEQYACRPVSGSPYPHYLLARYLAYSGTEEDRAPYLRGSQRWADPGSGVLAGHPWPQIQYFRWLMTDDDDESLRDALKQSIFYARGKDDMPTVELIVSAVCIAMGLFEPSMPEVRALLLKLGAQMPLAEPIVRQLLTASPGDRLLARRVLPFNFC
ncbi:MAG: hypothetical protein K6E40_11035 [Desulfovibrio sp.]|nr:hypothetical protein [Desulfovibrio sp.]